MLNKNKKGFTLLEILLVIVLMGGLAVLSAPVYNAYKIKNDLNVAVNTTAQTLYRAQVLSQAVDGDDSWGVNIANGNIVIYKGLSYAARDIEFDEEYEISLQITITGQSDIIFSKFSGLPQVTGDIILTSINNESKTININSQGMVQY